MFEKVNPAHPDKVADRIAGAVVDLAYARHQDPRIAVEVLLGHKNCFMVVETSVLLEYGEISTIVHRIAGDMTLFLRQVFQDKKLAENQKDGFRCGDNGIFRGVPVTAEQKILSDMVRKLYHRYGSDGKYILNGSQMIICQSNADSKALKELYPFAQVNPLGDWTGGLNVDTGATNRKLGSDMGDAVTGGGLHGKDLSKADVSVNIYAHIKAQETGEKVELCCAIGDAEVDGRPYTEIVEIARHFINKMGGFERLAEWGLI